MQSSTRLHTFDGVIKNAVRKGFDADFMSVSGLLEDGGTAQTIASTLAGEFVYAQSCRRIEDKQLQGARY